LIVLREMLEANTAWYSWNSKGMIGGKEEKERGERMGVLLLIPFFILLTTVGTSFLLTTTTTTPPPPPPPLPPHLCLLAHFCSDEQVEGYP